jgi:hypothetical protein
MGAESEGTDVTDRELRLDRVTVRAHDVAVRTRQLVDRYGFTPAPRTTSNDAVTLTRGHATVVLAPSPQGPVAVDLALRCTAAVRAFHIATAAGAHAIEPPAHADGWLTAAVLAPGGLSHTFVQPLPGTERPMLIRHPSTHPSTTQSIAPATAGEAHDPSTMECRMIAPCAEYASMMIVGDLGQATRPLAAGSWPQPLTQLGKRKARTPQLHTARLAAIVLTPSELPPRA